ncbi:MAG TPA: AAA family ATPase [Crocinitomicaceae bacterium]|nr:AAA family ATPase [Crocinitomicaceae bacterium]
MRNKRTYDEVIVIDKPSIKSGIKTLDAFLSNNGGFELGNLILMTGTSGAGKTTLCKLLQREIKEPTNFHALESLASSVKRQTSRIKIDHGMAYITDEEDYEDFDEFMKFLYEDKPLFVMVDSLQHAVKQLKKKGMGDTDAHHHVLDSLYKWKDETQGIVILICQLNKDGSFSGPSGMLFDADARIHLEFNPKTGERTMETFKNRMGQLDSIFYEFTSCDEVMKFYTTEEWEVLKLNVTLPEMIMNTVFQFAQAYKNQDNYPVFKKEFNKGIKLIYKKLEDDLEICVEVARLMSEMKNKYF